MHALLNEPTYSGFDIFILIDPWWGRIGTQPSINTSHDIYGTVNSPLFQCIIPPGITDAKGPGIAIYIRNNIGIHAQYSGCTSTHRDVLAIDLKIDKSVSTIIAAYPHNTTASDTVDFICNIVIPEDKPTILAGDFNLHHPNWHLINSKWEKSRPNASARQFNTYAEFNDLYIMNDLHHPTHIVPNRPHSNSIIDLTLLNSRAVDVWPNFNWEVEPPSSGRSLGSDHLAITWSITHWDQEDYSEEGTATSVSSVDLELRRDWIQSYKGALNGHDPPATLETAEDADRICHAILEAMSTATQTVNAGRKKKGTGPARSPWWTEECSIALNNLQNSPDAKSKEKHRAALRGAIRRARKNRGNKILAEISSTNVYQVLKWYQGKRRSLMPPIKSPNGGPTATHPYQKAENFGNQFFPKAASANISLEPLGVKNMPKRPHQPISKLEISESLEQTSNRSAPGAFGSNYRLLKWAFSHNSDTFVLLFNGCLRLGYHPTALRNTVISPIPKPRRPDMSSPKNYRPIALLETLSKLLEKVITHRILFEAGAHNLIPHSQFGGRDISSCTDAGLCMVHDIRSAWSRNQEVSLLTLDVSGYFNNVDHRRLHQEKPLGSVSEKGYGSGVYM